MQTNKESGHLPAEQILKVSQYFLQHSPLHVTLRVSVTMHLLISLLHLLDEKCTRRHEAAVRVTDQVDTVFVDGEKRLDCVDEFEQVARVVDGGAEETEAQKEGVSKAVHAMKKSRKASKLIT